MSNLFLRLSTLFAVMGLAWVASRGPSPMPRPWDAYDGETREERLDRWNRPHTIGAPKLPAHLSYHLQHNSIEDPQFWGTPPPEFRPTPSVSLLYPNHLGGWTIDCNGRPDCTERVKEALAKLFPTWPAPLSKGETVKRAWWILAMASTLAVAGTFAGLQVNEWLRPIDGNPGAAEEIAESCTIYGEGRKVVQTWPWPMEARFLSVEAEIAAVLGSPPAFCYPSVELTGLSEHDLSASESVNVERSLLP